MYRVFQLFIFQFNFFFIFFLCFSLELDSQELKAAEMKKICMVDGSRVTYFRSLLLFDLSLALRILCFRII